jgi:uncharacterized SAM-binding protein YcdF (DUF218 family)
MSLKQLIILGIIGLFLLCGTVSFWGSGMPVVKALIVPQQVDAIVLLAGSYEERLPAVTELFLLGYSNKIVLTNDGVKRGWLLDYNKNLYAIERSELDLIRYGIPKQAIIKLPFYKSGTVYDALMVKQYVLKHNIHSIMLVTSDYHTRRAYWIFNRIMKGTQIEIGVYPAKSRVGFFGLVKESIKSVYYTVKYGLLDMVPEILLR